MTFSQRICSSIPLKICLSILTVETLLLTIIGFYYTTKFNNEIDEAVLQKLQLPATLMSERAFNYDSVKDYTVMSELLQEEVTQSFVINTEGFIHYAANPAIEGLNYYHAIEGPEKKGLSRNLKKIQTIDFTTSNGNAAISILAPIIHQDLHLGALYLRIDAETIVHKKREIALLFLFGAVATILFTTLLEFWWVYRIFVPRLNLTSKALQQLEEYDFSHRLKNYGHPDQLGILMKQVDHMLDRLENYMKNLKKAETKYKDIFTSASDGIFRTSPGGKLLAANPALAQLTGYSSPEHMVGDVKNFAKQCCAKEKDRNTILNILLNKQRIQEYELPFKRRDGEVIIVSLSGHAVFAPNGKLQHFEGRLSDISERKALEKTEHERQSAEAVAQAKSELVVSLEKKNKQLEEALSELKHAQKQLIHSEKMAVLGLTASGVAHDLNNILSGLIGYPELLLAQLPEESDQRPVIEAILASGKRAAAVVADLLTLSRDAATKRDVVSLNTLVEEYLDSLEYANLLSQATNVHVKVALTPATLSLSCSRIHIQKVIMNLIMNAVEATKQGGEVMVRTFLEEEQPQEEICAKGLPHPGKYCVLEISDSGVGISPENLEHIFEPFYTRKVMGKEGTGLGLTIVSNIVREHQGFINVTAENHNTIFTVTLPMALSKAIDNNNDTRDNLVAQGTVLIIDDEPIQRDLGTQILTHLGYTVASVSSGELAIEYLKKTDVDLLLLDMIMAPGMNGLETYKKIIKNHPHQKAVIVSGFSLNEAVNEALSLGPSCFVQKPYTSKEIGKAVKDLLYPAN